VACVTHFWGSQATRFPFYAATYPFKIALRAHHFEGVAAPEHHQLSPTGSNPKTKTSSLRYECAAIAVKLNVLESG
jgi:hypothetical protein